MDSHHIIVAVRAMIAAHFVEKMARKLINVFEDDNAPVRLLAR